MNFQFLITNFNCSKRQFFKERIKLYGFFAGLIIVAFFCVGRVSANTQSTILVKMQSESLMPEALRDQPLDPLQVRELSVPEGISPQVYRDHLAKQPGVIWAEINSSLWIQAVTPNDTRFAEQTASTKIKLPEAWSESLGSISTVIGIVDTGIDGLHEDLGSRVVAGFNFVTNSPISAASNSDDNGHGTAVTGVVGALTNNTIGIAGVDWNAKLMPLKVADASGEATASRLASAITYAADNGVKVLNMSIGGTIDSQAVHDAITYALSKGVVMLAASGNEGGSILYPAAYSEVIAVGSVNSNDVQSSFSNFGPELDVVAPGEGILTTTLSGSHNTYVATTGTSLSTPFVTGVAALLIAKNPGITPSQIQTTIQNTADRPSGMGGQSFTNLYGNGRVNALRAVTGFQDFHAQFVGQNAYPELLVGQSYIFEVKLKNTGKSTWNQDIVHLATDRAQDRIPGFVREDQVSGTPSGWVSANRIGMQEGTVVPGEIGTFRFAYTVPSNKTPGIYREFFRPVADGITFMEDMGIFWDVRVLSVAETYHAQFVGQNAYPDLENGGAYLFEVKLKNTGKSTWQQGIVNLATDRGRDRVPQFIREDQVGHNPSGWVSDNRVRLVESSVAPGGLGTFQFYYTAGANLAPGIYREFFRPVADGITFMEDMGIFWDVRVLSVAETYHAQFVGQNAYPTLAVGNSYLFEVRLKNTGKSTWNQDIVHLATDRARDRIPGFIREDQVGGNPSGWVSANRVKMLETSVAPNGSATFQFYYTAPADKTPGTYREFFRPVADGITFMEDMGIFWDVTVTQ